MSHVANFSLQADETPCTILYTIGDQKVDVGKATIMEPKEPLFHSRPIPRTSSRFPWPVSNRATRICLLQYYWGMTTRHRDDQ